MRTYAVGVVIHNTDLKGTTTSQHEALVSRLNKLAIATIQESLEDDYGGDVKMSDGRITIAQVLPLAPVGIQGVGWLVSWSKDGEGRLRDSVATLISALKGSGVSGEIGYDPEELKA